MLNFGMLQDFRLLHGDESLGVQLRDCLCSAVHRHTVFFPNMAGHVVRFPPPFTLLGRIRVECDGEHKGKVDLKKAGIFVISAGASLLALESGMIGGTTWSKLEFLGKQNVFTPGDLARIENAFTFLTRLRLQQQLSAESTPSNCVDLHNLPDEVRSQFRQALKGVKTFIWIFRNHYHLDFFSI
jgi:CBS domain-containing protein